MAEYRFLKESTREGVMILTVTDPEIDKYVMEEVLAAVASSKPQKLILDLQAVRRILFGSLHGDMEGARRLLHLKDEMAHEGGRLSLCRLAPPVEDVFRICNIDRVFEIHPDVDVAFASMQR
jgi:anti-anti-sigma factor